MAQSSGGVAAAPSLRIVQLIPGRSIIVAFPQPLGTDASQQSSSSRPLVVAATLPTHDSAFWRRYSYRPDQLKISTILRGLGLRQINPGPGRSLFHSNSITQLADAVAEVAKRLPTATEQLVNVASDYDYAPLKDEVKRLLRHFGDGIWGAKKHRPWLLQASEGVAEYQKDLVSEDSDDEAVLVYYLRLWVLAKAFNSLRNKGASRTKVASQASADGQGKREATGKISKPSLPFRNVAAANLATSSFRKTVFCDVSQEQANLVGHNNLQVRRTARTSKPREYVDVVNNTSDMASDERTQSETDLSSDVPRGHKGRARKKEGDETSAMHFTEKTRTSKYRIANFPHGTNSRPRGRPKGSKSKIPLPEAIVRDKDSGDDTTLKIKNGMRRSKEPRKEALSVDTHALEQMQEHVDGAEPRSRRMRYKKRIYLSETIIRNGSDESEKDHSLTQTSIREDVGSAVVMDTPYLASHTKQRHHGAENSPAVTGLDQNSQKTLSVLDSTAKSSPVRRPTGACKSCSQRHQGCDRTHPTCGRCADHGFSCEYPRDSDHTAPPSAAAPIGPQKEQGPLPDRLAKGRLNGEHYTPGEPAINITMPPARYRVRNLSLDEYWDEETWRYFYSSYCKPLIMRKTMQSLGLMVDPRDPRKLKFDIEYFISLGEDVDEIAGSLSSHFSAMELIRYAADRDYLDDHIDTLFETHSPIWSLDADRTKLRAPGADECYPKDLFYEESEDQKILWLHLHRWIFIVALNNWREKDQSTIKNTDAMPQLKDAEFPEISQSQLKQSDISQAPEGSFGSVSPTAPVDYDLPDEDSTTIVPALPDSMFAVKIPEDGEVNLLEARGQYFAETRVQETKQGDSSSLHAAKTGLATNKPSRHGRKRKDSGIIEPEDQDVLRPLKQRHTDQQRLTSKGHDFSALFMSYLKTYTNPEFDELAALQTLANELSSLKDHAKRGLEFATAFFDTFPAWLVYRQAIVNAKRKYASMQSSEQVSHRHLAVMERSRLATQLRQAHEKFMDAGHDGLRPEQIIHLAMITLQKEHGHSQTAEEIRIGFQGMEYELKMLGDQLMKTGGAKWIMGDFASIASFDGLKPERMRGL